MKSMVPKTRPAQRMDGRSECEIDSSIRELDLGPKGDTLTRVSEPRRPMSENVWATLSALDQKHYRTDEDPNVGFTTHPVPAHLPMVCVVSETFSEIIFAMTGGSNFVSCASIGDRRGPGKMNK